MAKVSFLAGIPGAGKSTVVKAMKQNYAEAEKPFDFELITFSTLMKEKIKESMEADELRKKLSLEKTYQLQNDVYKDIFSREGNIIIDSHSRIFLPGSAHSFSKNPELKSELDFYYTKSPDGIFSNGFPESLHKEYHLVGVALIEPENIASLEKQRAGDSSRKRDDFPSAEVQQREEYRSAQKIADLADCPFLSFKNIYGKAKETALQLSDFLEDCYALDR